MYERNAIVIDRYFADMFGYDENSNLKNNYKNYFELVKNLEKYQEVSETEDNMMVEFEKTANGIKETQKIQEVLNRRNIKLQESRKSLFENLDESAESLRKRFAKIEEELNKNNNDIKSNTEKFIIQIADFHEKSITRTECGRERRVIESEYQKILQDTTNFFNNSNQEKIKSAKMFLKQESDEEVKNQIKEEIMRNGAKEKVPFDENVINKAIDLATEVEERRLEIYISLYEKTMRILAEIKNDTVKIERHKKVVKDSESKLQFLNTISEYIILFLDNERMNVMGGEKEHKKIMEEACNNYEKDIIEIQNMYELLIKEITSKSSKKAYKELYHPEYLQDMKEDEKEFEKSVSKLNMIGTVIYPNYWRVEGMQKIFDIFRQLLTEVYGKDLSEYEPIQISEEKRDIINFSEDDDFDLDFDFDDDWKDDDEEKDEEPNDENEELEEDNNDYDEDDELEEDEEDEKYEDDSETDNETDYDDDFEWEDDSEDEIDDDEEDVEEETEEDKRDKEIDEILGFFEQSSDDDEFEDYEDIDFEEDNDFEEEIREKKKESTSKKEKTTKKKESKSYVNDFWDEDEEDFKDDEEQQQNSNKKKKKSFFGRNKK